MHDFTHHVRGRRLVLSADEAFGFYATTVLGYFADLVDQWRDGMTVRVGWALFRLAYDAEGDGARIQSPTYGTSPELTFTDDCSLGLWVQAGQAATLLKAKVDPLDCGYDDRIIYHHDALASPRIYLERQGNTQPGDSGWYVGPLPPTTQASPDNLVSVHTFQLTTVRPEIMKLLMLPAGTIALVDGHTVEEVVDADDRVLIRGPY